MYNLGSQGKFSVRFVIVITKGAHLLARVYVCGLVYCAFEAGDSYNHFNLHTVDQWPGRKDQRINKDLCCARLGLCFHMESFSFILTFFLFIHIAF